MWYSRGTLHTGYSNKNSTLWQSTSYRIPNMHILNPLSGIPTKWPNILKQIVGKLPTNCLSVFDHFVKFALKGLIFECVSSPCFSPKTHPIGNISSTTYLVTIPIPRIPRKFGEGWKGYFGQYLLMYIIHQNLNLR